MKHPQLDNSHSYRGYWGKIARINSVVSSWPPITPNSHKPKGSWPLEVTNHARTAK